MQGNAVNRRSGGAVTAARTAAPQGGDRSAAMSTHRIPVPVQKRIRPSVGGVVTAAVRPILVGAAGVVIGILAGLTWYVVSSRPDLDHARDGASALSASQQAMDAEQTALVSYLDTASPGFLAAYNADTSDAARANAAASAAFRAAGNVSVNNLFAGSWTAAQAWTSQWAQPVATGSWTRLADTNGDGVLSPAERAAFSAEGSSLFAAYQQRQGAVVDAARSGISATLEDQFVAVLACGIAVLGVGVAAVLVLVRGRRRLRAGVTGPIEHLVSEADRVASGDYSPITAPADTSVHEVAELLGSLQHITTALIAERDAAEYRAAQLLERTRRQNRLIELSRDLSASLSKRAVVTTLNKALRVLANADTIAVWVQDWDNDTLTKYAVDDHSDEESVRIGAGPIGRTAQYARRQPLHGPRSASESGVGQQDAWAVPLVIGAKVVGVVVVQPLAGLTLDWEMLDALIQQGSAALQAALMHSQAEEQSRRDPLTDLANRRQLTLDLAREVERAQRFDHPLSFVMLDLDHFKRLNDSYGHPRGDEVLKGVAEVISREIRSVDTAYRYGGEELAILMRQSSGSEAMATANRLRALVSREFGWARESPVSFSAGVAELRGPNETARDLIAAADAALYAAKNAGRDRVVLFPFDEDRRAG